MVRNDQKAIGGPPSSARTRRDDIFLIQARHYPKEMGEGGLALLAMPPPSPRRQERTHTQNTQEWIVCISCLALQRSPAHPQKSRWSVPQVMIPNVLFIYRPRRHQQSSPPPPSLFPLRSLLPRLTLAPKLPNPTPKRVALHFGRLPPPPPVCPVDPSPQRDLSSILARKPTRTLAPALPPASQPANPARPAASLANEPSTNRPRR